ncbi:GNAT family N-acetyltransferase [archaeon]|nr:GNAT family N-acetyltransferase [archaeon]MBT7128986.1 GNAT family N-acetyltransferase [archaeon]
MKVKCNEALLSKEIIELISLSFSHTSDSSLDEWLSFSEIKKAMDRGEGVCLEAVDESGLLIGMIYAQQENLVNGKEGFEKWVVIVEAVHPNKRGKGVGSSLLEAVEVYVKKKGAKKMFVFTNKKDKGVIDFYKKNDYEDAGWVKDYQYGEDNSAVFLLKYI